MCLHLLPVNQMPIHKCWHLMLSQKLPQEVISASQTLSRWRKSVFQTSGLLLVPRHKLTSFIHLGISLGHVATMVNYATSFAGEHLNGSDPPPTLLHLALELDLNPRLRSQVQCTDLPLAHVFSRLKQSSPLHSCGDSTTKSHLSK